MDIKVIDTVSFIQKSSIVHESKYDYSLSKYVNTRSKLKIICPEHGEFEQTPRCHLQGKGCSQCAPNAKTNQKDILNRLKEQFGDSVDYSLVNFKTTREPITLICPEHGQFSKPVKAIFESKHACPKCSGVAPVSQNSFIERANEIHCNKYDYSKVKMIKTKEKVTIICNEHGAFEQTPSKHLSGNGCPSCCASSGERLIESFFIKHNIEYQKEYPLLKNPETRCWLRADFYIPSKNLVIEYDGIQHFKAIDHFGGLSRLRRTKKLDKLKNDFCEKKDIAIKRFKYNQKDLVVLNELSFLFNECIG